jgi:hypothetical protein
MIENSDMLVCPQCGSEEWMEEGQRVFVPKGLVWQAKRAGLLAVEDEVEICEHCPVV